MLVKVVVLISMSLSISIVWDKFYIKKKGLIEIWMQGGYPKKIDFYEIVLITQEFPKLIIVDHYFCL
jgi:hypothetical protein